MGLLYGTGPILVDVDAADYAPSTMFRYDAVWTAASGSLSCLRLFDLTANGPVSGSEVCRTIPANTGTEDAHVRSARIFPANRRSRVHGSGQVRGAGRDRLQWWPRLLGAGHR